ncbi:hypothetical protein HY374_00330 [Candidatus Berkelbacteria bacterium]|nr:hypothetical protein [Candidatus Berkelbacteria bacterium]
MNDRSTPEGVSGSQHSQGERSERTERRRLPRPDPIEVAKQIIRDWDVAADREGLRQYAQTQIDEREEYSAWLDANERSPLGRKFAQQYREEVSALVDLARVIGAGEVPGTNWELPSEKNQDEAA